MNFCHSDGEAWKQNSNKATEKMWQSFRVSPLFLKLTWRLWLFFSENISIRFVSLREHSKRHVEFLFCIVVFLVTLNLLKHFLRSKICVIEGLFVYLIILNHTFPVITRIIFIKTLIFVPTQRKHSWPEPFCPLIFSPTLPLSLHAYLLSPEISVQFFTKPFCDWCLTNTQRSKNKLFQMKANRKLLGVWMGTRKCFAVLFVFYTSNH